MFVRGDNSEDNCWYRWVNGPASGSGSDRQRHEGKVDIKQTFQLVINQHKSYERCVLFHSLVTVWLCSLYSVLILKMGMTMLASFKT